MLYVTTRNNRDAFTVQHAVKENCSADGGFYLPYQVPQFSAVEIASLQNQSFNQCIADVLNKLFSTELTSWDIDFCIGRYPVRLNPLGHRIIVGETWHNPDWNYERMVSSLMRCLSKDESTPTDWVRIAVRIAVLFGIFAELQRSGITMVDISVVAGDFSAPISAWYARHWGLPIGNIICCCNENNNLWDLICHGHLRTDDVSVPTIIPEADIVLPKDLERLIHACGGTAEVEQYLSCCRSGNAYTPSDPVLAKLRQGIYVSVVSSKRSERTIPHVYRTHDYVMEPCSAMAYAGLQDYRVKTGVTRHAIVLSEKSAVCEKKMVAKTLDITEEKLLQIL